jgi:porphobilinogen synthase
MESSLYHQTRRPRRNRRNEAIRRLVRETTIEPSNMILPLFVKEGQHLREPIPSMPGIFRLSIDEIIAEAKRAFSLGIPGVALFPVIPESKKDRLATESANPDGLYPRAIRALKEAVPELQIFTDVAMDPYSSDGHDGLVAEDGRILNDETLEILRQMALTQARAGADFVAPSDMMDGRVGYIRAALDENGFADVGILSYTAKYASAFYGPFRDALSSAPKFGDKKTYQMDPANVREALLELDLDIEEGADMVMVKPGLPYLDVVRALAEKSPVPVAVYNVSGEYAMLRAASERNWLDYRRCVFEVLTAFRRAGADIILTYHALEAAEWMN